MKNFALMLCAMVALTLGGSAAATTYPGNGEPLPAAAGVRDVAAPPAGIVVPTGGVCCTPQGPMAVSLPSAPGVLVHLKAGVCNQVVTLSAKASTEGGYGVTFVSDPGGQLGLGAFHFPTYPNGPVGHIWATQWIHVDFHVPKLHYTYTFASSDCLDPNNDGLYIANATTVKVSVT